jgi:hypothetical protein
MRRSHCAAHACDARRQRPDAVAENAGRQSSAKIGDRRRCSDIPFLAERFKMDELGCCEKNFAPAKEEGGKRAVVLAGVKMISLHKRAFGWLKNNSFCFF